jgi:hypothetical protein
MQPMPKRDLRLSHGELLSALLLHDLRKATLHCQAPWFSGRGGSDSFILFRMNLGRGKPPKATSNKIVVASPDSPPATWLLTSRPTQTFILPRSRPNSDCGAMGMPGDFVNGPCGSGECSIAIALFAAFPHSRSLKCFPQTIADCLQMLRSLFV